MLSTRNQYSFSMAGLLALSLWVVGAFGVFGAIGCNNADANQETNAPSIPPMPGINVPVVKYNFYEPISEDALKKDTNYGYLIAKTRPGFNDAAFKSLGLKVASRFLLNGAAYYHLYKDGGVLEALKGVKKISGVMFAEPELMHYQDAVEPNPINYDDPDALVKTQAQWPVFITKAMDAWTNLGFGPHKPVVANVDSGIRINHEEFFNAGQSIIRHAYSWYMTDSNTELSNQNPLSEPEPTDYKNSNRTNTDYRGNNFPETPFGHGTHTSGTIAAVGNNGKGVAGICWNVDLISYKAIAGGSGGNWPVYGSLWHLAKWKRQNNYACTIPVNMSLGSLSASHFAIDMIEQALQNDILVVTSAGNSGVRLRAYPAAYSGVIAVGATNGGDRRAVFSNYGSHLSVVAPGHGVMSTFTDASVSGESNLYYSDSGTSMACPHVTGLAAYLLTFNPALKPDQIKTYIERNADFIEGAAGFTEETGWGRINVLKTVRAVIDDVNSGAAPPSDYVMSPIKITVVNTSGNSNPLPVNDMSVYLYQCDAAGQIANYVASAITGTSLVVWREDGETEDGVAYFNMLKPGYYVAKANYFMPDAGGMDSGDLKSTGVFEVRQGQAALEMKIAFDKRILYIQTYASRADALMTESEIWLYDSETGEHILYEYYDRWYQTASCLMPVKPGAYWIRITDRTAASYGSIPSEYALWVTNDYASLKTSSAAGSYANPAGGVRGSETQSRTNSQQINFDTIYYGRFESADAKTAGDYYRFVVQ